MAAMSKNATGGESGTTGEGAAAEAAADAETEVAAEAAADAVAVVTDVPHQVAAAAVCLAEFHRQRKRQPKRLALTHGSPRKRWLIPTGRRRVVMMSEGRRGHASVVRTD